RAHHTFPPRRSSDLNDEVPRDAHLSRQHTIFADLGRTRYSGLGGDHGVTANFYIVRNLYQVIEFYAGADHGSVAGEGRTVDHRVCPNGDIIFYNDFTELGNRFVTPVFLLCEAEAVAADDRSRMDHDIIADDRVGIDLHP